MNKYIEEQLKTMGKGLGETDQLVIDRQFTFIETLIAEIERLEKENEKFQERWAQDVARLGGESDILVAKVEWLEKKNGDMLCAIQNANKSLEDTTQENTQLLAIVEKAKALLNCLDKEDTLWGETDVAIELLQQAIAKLSEGKKS